MVRDPLDHVSVQIINIQNVNNIGSNKKKRIYEIRQRAEKNLSKLNNLSEQAIWEYTTQNNLDENNGE